MLNVFSCWQWQHFFLKTGMITMMSYQVGLGMGSIDSTHDLIITSTTGSIYKKRIVAVAALSWEIVCLSDTIQVWSHLEADNNQSIRNRSCSKGITLHANNIICFCIYDYQLCHRINLFNQNTNYNTSSHLCLPRKILITRTRSHERSNEASQLWCTYITVTALHIRIYSSLQAE